MAVVPPDELRQEAAANLQSGTNVHAGSVKVAELDKISNSHVSPPLSFPAELMSMRDSGFRVEYRERDKCGQDSTSVIKSWL